VRGNPFADVPVLDYVRDVVAAVLLVISFGLPWDAQDTVTGKVYVILVTLLSIMSLTLPYLKRAGVLPATWGTAELRLARLAANAPYIIVVLITLVLGYIGDNDGDGVGVGIAFGLAAALLAAQGRQAEQGHGQTAGEAVLWRWIATAVAGLFVVLTAISLIIFLAEQTEGQDWDVIAYQVVAMLLFPALVALPIVGMARGRTGGKASGVVGAILAGGSASRAAWRDVLIVLGAAALFVSVWQAVADDGLLSEGMQEAWSLRTVGPQLIFIPALAVAVSAPSLQAAFRGFTGASRWVAVCTRLFLVTMVVAVFGVVLYVVEMIGVEAARGISIVILVLNLIVLVAAVVGRNALIRDPNLGRGVAVVCAGVFIVLGIVIVTVLGASDDAIVGITDATIVSVLWWSALAVAAALTAPPSVRREFGPIAADQINFAAVSLTSSAADDSVASPAEQAAETATLDGSGQRPGGGRDAMADGEGMILKESATSESSTTDDVGTRVDLPAVAPSTMALPDDVPPGEADQPSAPQSEPGFDAAMARNPNTPLQVLADIAAQEPSLRKDVAANPSAYPELLTWLGQLGDPEVDEVLRQRGQ
jgi:hypothetical protein